MHNLIWYFEQWMRLGKRRKSNQDQSGQFAKLAKKANVFPQKPESEDGHARSRHWLQFVAELLDQLRLVLLLRAANERGVGSHILDWTHLRVVVVVVASVLGEGLAVLLLLFAFSVVGATVGAWEKLLIISECFSMAYHFLPTVALYCICILENQSEIPIRCSWKFLQTKTCRCYYVQACSYLQMILPPVAGTAGAVGEEQGTVHTAAGSERNMKGGMRWRHWQASGLARSGFF